MSLKFMLARNSITGRNLVRAYEAEGGQISELAARGAVCYGAPYRGTLPALNANAGTFDKYRELELLRAGGVEVPKFSRDGSGLSLPLLGRLNHHTKGLDIIPILGSKELEWARPARNFFTQYIPLAEEYRVWTFRTRNIGTYKKVFTYPQKYKQFGCNNDNGFAFQHIDYTRETLDLGVAALKALKLDFGAVDILKGQDGKYYVLEVNTAPGTEQGVLSRLARQIRQWELDGCPDRDAAVRINIERRRCQTCSKINCLCAARRGRRAFVCCGKRRCICGRNIR